MQRWSLWHSSEGFHLAVTKTPAWALAVSRVTELIDAATRHQLCGSRAPDLLWHIPVGRPRYSYDVSEGEERWLENSLAGLMVDIFNYLAGRDVMEAQEILRLPLTAEQASALGWEPYEFEDEETV